MALHTVGYEGTDMEGFLRALRAHGIKTVVDVRELPLSRKRGFSKKALAERLRLNGVSYVHMRALGCPRRIRHQYRADGDWERYEHAFLAHLKMQDGALASLGGMTAQSQTALLCFEADAHRCHRSLVAAAVARLDPIAVLHITTAAEQSAGER